MPLIPQQDIVSVSFRVQEAAAAASVKAIEGAMALLREKLESYPPVRIVSLNTSLEVRPGGINVAPLAIVTAVVETV